MDAHLHVKPVGHLQAGSRSPAGWCPSPRGASGRRRRRGSAPPAASGVLAFPLPKKPRLIGSPSAAWSMRARWKAPGVQVVALVPVAGPVPPPISVVTPLARAVSICWGQMKWMWVSIAPAVRMWPSPAIASVPGPPPSVDARLDVGVARLADRHDAAVPQADVGLDDPPPVEDHGVGDHGVHRPGGLIGWSGPGPCRRGSPCRRRISPRRRSAVKSFSTSRISSVSASRSRSPVVGP